MKKQIGLALMLSMICCISACGKNIDEDGYTERSHTEEVIIAEEEERLSENAGMEKNTEAVSNGQNQSVFSNHEPYGPGVGAMPGRVVWNYEPSSVSWDGSGYC